MSRGTAKKAKELDAQPQLIFDPKRDINPFWRSSLFSDVYLKNDVPREYKHLWENDEIGGFYNFYQGFIDLCVETEHECFEKWKEADTVKNWIVHVMDLLGWENNSERRSNSYMDNESFTISDCGRKQTYRPDLIYFDKPKHKSYTQKEKDIDKKLLEAKNERTGAKIVVEAKYWDRLSQLGETSSKDTKVNDSASALGPELQTLKYMEIFKHDFGILTDGKTWKLFHSELSKGIDRRSFDFDLGNLRELALDIGSYGNEEKFRHFAKYFYYFFSKESLIQSDDSKTAPFVHEVFEYSKKYAHSIEEDLKKRFIVTMGVTCNALKKSCDDLNEKIDLESIRNVSESHLFNILFVKSCEVRRILPISSTQYLRVSLHEVIETLDAMKFDPDKDWDDYLRDFRHTFGKKFDWDGFEIFKRFINLYEVIHDGTAKTKDFGFEIEGFKESIFANAEWKFAKKHKINNREMVLILFNLNFIESSFKGRKYQQIPYSYFTPRQLGSIYESFLEYKLEIAEEDLIFTSGQWVKGNHSSRKVRELKLADEYLAPEGSLFFSPNNEERKMTGSYYTPDYVVKFIVDRVVGASIKNKSCEEITKSKFIDPSMGSGHFLAGALEYIVGEYRKKWVDENNDDLNEPIECTSREILKNCLYGLDINKRAVKLAKMSLWLQTAFPGEKLEDLDDQFIVSDSLDKPDWHKSLKVKGKFDGVIGNPPYLNYKLIPEAYKKNVLKKKFSDSYSHKSDISNYFMVAASRNVNKSGRVSFIVPRYFLDSFEAKNLRKVLGDSYNIETIVNFGNFQVFKENTLTIIPIMKSKDDKHSTIELYDMDEIMSQQEDVLSTNLGGLIDNIEATKVSQSDYLEDASKCRLDSIQGNEVEQVQIEDYVFIGRGMQTGADKVFVLNESDCKEKKIEKKYLKKTYKNGDLRSYHLYDSNKYMIYVSKGDSFDKSSNAYKYMKENKEKLEARYEASKGKCEWWELAVYRCDKHFEKEKEKIIFPYMATDNRFIVDNSKTINASDVGIMVVKDKVLSHKSLAAILNSSKYNEIHKKVGKLKRDGYYEYVSNSLKKYTLPKTINKADVKQLEDLYDGITSEYAGLKEEVSPNNKKKEFDDIEQTFLKYPEYLEVSGKTDFGKYKEISSKILKICELKKDVDSIVRSMLELDEALNEAA